jgi:hypothetical protein
MRWHGRWHGEKKFLQDFNGENQKERDNYEELD